MTYAKSFFFALCLSLMPALGTAAGLVRGIGSEPESFDPHKAVGTSASVVIYDLFEGLVTVDAAGEAAPGAAENWSTNADRSVYTLSCGRTSNGPTVRRSPQLTSSTRCAVCSRRRRRLDTPRSCTSSKVLAR